MASTSKNNGAPASSYFGGKGGSGTYQTIINQIRPHHTYIEPFLGGGSIMLHKAKAAKNVGIDLDDSVIQSWIARKDPDIQLSTFCGIKYLESLVNSGITAKTVIYCDPPYPLGSRKSQKEVYRHEMTDEQHRQLLAAILSLPCDVLISTYPNKLYADMLRGWHCVSFQNTTRQGPATELLYMNYTNEAGLLHDYSYIGENYRERERIKKKIDRHVARLQELPAPERNAILHAITSSCSTGLNVAGHTAKNDNDRNVFRFNAYGVCINPDTVFSHETKHYRIEIEVASDNEDFWAYGYDLHIKVGSRRGTVSGTSFSRRGNRFDSKNDAAIGAAKAVRTWIKEVVEENNSLSPQTFSHFYDWYNQQTQLRMLT